MHNTIPELSVLLGCIYGGLCIGIVYDVYSLLTLPVHNRFIRAFFDLFFYAAVLCIAALFLVFLNGGHIRLYALMGFAVGAFFYRFTTGQLFRAIGRHILHIFSHFWSCF